MKESDVKYDRVGYMLFGKGNVSSFFLIIIPLFIDLTVRYNWLTAVVTMVVISVLLVALLWLQYRVAGQSKTGYGWLLAIMMASFALVYFSLQQPLSAIAFIGVMLAGLQTYMFGRIGRIFGHLIVLNIITWNYLLQTPAAESDWNSFSLLITLLAMAALMIEFISDSIELSRQELEDISRSNRKIRVEHQRLLSLINNIGDAVIATDYEGTIQTYNGAALELLDTNVSITGKRLDDVSDLIDEAGNRVDLVAEARKMRRTVRRNDIRLRYTPDDIANLYINVTPIKVGYGQHSENGFTLILRDITKEKSLEEERDEFVSVVSHELRTPVTITEGKVSNALLLLEKGDLDSKKFEHSLEQAHNQVVYLSNMINDLSSLARAERAESQMDLERVDPRKLAEELAASYHLQAEEKGLKFKLDYSGDLPALYTSKLYLMEILQNFITNSIKYTKKGQVALKVEPAGFGRVRFSVSDTGIGISKSDKKHLFEKFFRSEDYRTRESSGTGLGLYVTRKLINKLQGKIEIESVLNKGSTFTLVVGSLEDKSHHGQSGS